MSCFFIARILIKDAEKYQQYLDGFDDVFSKYNGDVVLVDEEPVVLEGDWKHTRLVMIRFPDEAEARRWYFSPEYQQLKQFRQTASDADIILVTDSV